MPRFVEYDWDCHIDVVLDEDSWEVKMMKTHQEREDGNFIWESCVGGFTIYDTWNDLEIADNTRSE